MLSFFYVAYYHICSEERLKEEETNNGKGKCGKQDPVG